MNFLPVGHTHEDIDQMLSEISTFLERQGAGTLSSERYTIIESKPYTLSSLVFLTCSYYFINNTCRPIQCNSEMFTPIPTIHLKKVVYDVKNWLVPAISDLHGHTQPLHFKFIRNDYRPVVRKRSYTLKGKAI